MSIRSFVPISRHYTYLYTCKIDPLNQHNSFGWSICWLSTLVKIDKIDISRFMPGHSNYCKCSRFLYKYFNFMFFVPWIKELRNFNEAIKKKNKLTIWHFEFLSNYKAICYHFLFHAFLEKGESKLWKLWPYNLRGLMDGAKHRVKTKKQNRTNQQQKQTIFI